MNALLRRVISGDGIRKSRFHNYRGERIDLGGLRYLPAAVTSTLLFKLTGHRPERPWLGYRAVRRIAGLLTPQSRVLEFGSGSSTVWLADRSGHVTALEDNAEWHRRISQRLAARHTVNVDYRFLETAQAADPPGVPERAFDFVLIDAYVREDVMPAALRKAKPGAWVYLDNCDFGPTFEAAERMLLAVATSPPEYFTDFAPTKVCATQGVLARV